MKQNPLPRLDKASALREELLPFCRLQMGEVWVDPVSGHRVGCLDSAESMHITTLMNGAVAQLAIHDPPYNLVAFAERTLSAYIAWCRRWVENTLAILGDDSALYIWLGADQNNHYQPLPDFMLMMRDYDVKPRSFITMRNQRGYGTQNNWMAVRQELLYYTKGNPPFNVQYTDIPKILKGYYKTVNGHRTENSERSKSDTIRASNVWVDVQQVFYRLQENVSGCYAQKPLKSIERIINTSSQSDDIVVDFFAHSGTTLLAAERLNRICYTCDSDPLYCELTIRRLEHYRKTKQTGWQNANPFEETLSSPC